jgi:hypothetical protein
MTKLEEEIAELRDRLNDLAERVRLDAVAEQFYCGTHEIREGDYFILEGSTFATRLASVSSDGKWTYFNGKNSIEPFRIPEPDENERLYTIAEVAEIVARAKR